MNTPIQNTLIQLDQSLTQPNKDWASPARPASLYNPLDVRDNCGFGLIAHQQGQASHTLVQTAIESLTCMTHRGAIAADGRTGDGCGLLMSLPQEFCRAVVREQFGVDLADLFAVGMLFLSQDAAKRNQAQQVIQDNLESYGLHCVGWRLVPIDPSICGEQALKQMPAIYQVFIESHNCKDKEELNRKLYCVRGVCEVALDNDADFYIASLSASVLIYKGLVMPRDLPRFYLDLADTRLAASICLFHQRFSTNTLPRWSLAQPFRYLAHNGEINTISGNRRWSRARAGKFATALLPKLQDLGTPVNQTGSDSSALDNMLDLLVAGGMNLFKAIRLLLPPAWQNVDTMDAQLRAFYEYNSMHMESWDGPAGIVLTDGRHALSIMDRNGLRPARWVMTDNGFITIASEIGTWAYRNEQVVAKGRVGPGQMLVIDTQEGTIKHTADIEAELKDQKPYYAWLKKYSSRIKGKLQEENDAAEQLSAAQLAVYQKLFMVTREEVLQILKPMAEQALEAVGSMGDDTPMAVLSQHLRPLSDYFRQQFAQVTNPPIDSLREAIVMSLETCLGKERNVFEETPERASRIILKSPILSRSKFIQILAQTDPQYQHERLDLQFEPSVGLHKALLKLCDRAEAAVRSGKTFIVLNDAQIERHLLPIPALLATGAVHHRLIQQGLRCDSNILLKTAMARDPHQFACLIGFGATAIYPYLAYQLIDDLVASKQITLPRIEAQRQYRKATAKGLLKILSKMGISTVASYRGAQLFEIVGLSDAVVSLCFNGASSRIGGADFSDLQRDLQQAAALAWNPRKPVSNGGAIKYMHDGEYHAFNPDVVMSLQRAVQTGRFEDYLTYVQAIEGRGIAYLRDLLVLKTVATPLAIDQVEPVEAILKRFDSAGMSLGALSPEAHETLAMAMNRLGARSNSGEGGEDPARFGTDKNSKIKQIASGRFGVTPAYLMSAEVLQIKIAQGAKPGEGGQLPGSKVNELIARLRYAVPGVTLISPPPHHDIYSIEDLAQLIFDLKSINPRALVSVKLVSEPGVGTIAAGVVKAYADLITLSGYDGGTAASPLSSIRHAGSPWELGLTEVHQTLRANGLRGRVRLQTDGGLKTGLDVVKAAILGAESFGFGTTPMIAMGCKYLRICHLNNCATGVATQDLTLRDQHYQGDVEKVMNFFRFIAQDTRQWLARLGVTRLQDLVGRMDLLEQIEGITPKQRKINLAPLLDVSYTDSAQPQTCQVESNPSFDQAELAMRILTDVLPAIENKTGGSFSYAIRNCDRSMGARLSGEIAKRYGNQGLQDTPLQLNFTGTAGQSFGVWNVGGLRLRLEGDANDYVGKGMTGGEIVIYPPKNSRYLSQETAIVGNTCLYGATGGRLYAAGRAGERFAVRNSGAIAVIEGAGDHCCEYMTGGVVVVLGRTGHNFAAGMTGGMAYVLDREQTFVDAYNPELVDSMRIVKESMEAYQEDLMQHLQDYVAATGSAWGQSIVEQFDELLRYFWLIKPKAASLDSLLAQSRAQPA